MPASYLYAFFGKMFGSSAHFLIRLFGFLQGSCVSSLYILVISPLLDICFANTFCHSLGCLSSCWWFPFFCKSLLAWWAPTCLFLLLLLLFWSLIQKIIARSGVTTRFSFYEFYGFRSYIQIFNPFWVNFCVQYKIVVSFFGKWLSNFLNTVYWRDWPFSHCVCLPLL